MHVRFLAHSFPRHADDPVGSFVLRLAVSLREAGIVVDVVAPGGQGLPLRDSLEGIAVRRFRYAPARWETLAYTGSMQDQVRTSWRARAAMLGFLAAEVGTALQPPVPDLVHAHWWFPGGLVGWGLSALWQRPLVTTLHGSDLRATESALGRRLFGATLRAADTVTTVSSALAEAAAAAVPGLRPVAAPMPVVPDLFHPGVRATDNRVLFVGKLNVQKGIEPFLQAFAAMREPATADIVVGVGGDPEPWQQRAASLGIAARLRWHPLLAQRELAALYRSATVLAMPARREGLGLVAIEAQLSGMPVVAFASGGLTDIVEDGRTGFLVPVDDVAGFAAALDRVLRAPDRGAALGVAGRARALERFAPARVAGRYAALYRHLVRGQS